MAVATDHSRIQFRVLNSRKGPAVRGTRAQTDRLLYKSAIVQKLQQQPNLWLFQQAVDDLLVEQGGVRGVITQIGIRFFAENVVLTTGTRSEEHTSELQSRPHLVCRLLLEKKK